MPRGKSHRTDEPKAPAPGEHAAPETKPDDLEKNDGVAVATVEKDETPAAPNDLPAGQTLNLADLQAMSMPRLQKMARDGGVETRGRSRKIPRPLHQRHDRQGIRV